MVTSWHIAMRGFSLHIPVRGYFFTYSCAWLFFTHSCAWLLLYIFLCVAFLCTFLVVIISSQIPVHGYLFTHSCVRLSLVRKRWEGEGGRGVGVETEAKRVIRTLTSIRKAPHACCKMLNNADEQIRRIPA